MLPGKYLWRNRISNRKSETYWSSEGWLTDSGLWFLQEGKWTAHDAPIKPVDTLFNLSNRAGLPA